MSTSKYAICITIACTSVFCAAASSICQQEIATNEDQPLIKFLEANKHTINDDNTSCIAEAIYVLGEHGTPKAVRTLVEYLDYKEPLAGGHKRKADAGMADLSYDPYPAVRALLQIGTPAIPVLVDALKNGDPSSLSFKNAVQAYMQIYSHTTSSSDGIKNLKVNIDKEIDADVKGHLLEALSMSLNKWCGPQDSEHHSQCEAALQQ